MEIPKEDWWIKKAANFMVEYHDNNKQNTKKTIKFAEGTKDNDENDIGWAGEYYEGLQCTTITESQLQLSLKDVTIVDSGSMISTLCNPKYVTKVHKVH